MKRQVILTPNDNSSAFPKFIMAILYVIAIPIIYTMCQSSKISQYFFSKIYSRGGPFANRAINRMQESETFGPWL